jgi:hypothetical protein
MANLSDNHISTLLALGADAMSNMYDVKITLPTDLQELYSRTVTEMTFRAKGFTPPQLNPKVYDVQYKTVTVKRPATKIEGERSFEIEFRLDAYYNIYKVLAAWKNRTSAGTTGYATNAINTEGANNTLGIISVYALAEPVYMDNGGEGDNQGWSRGTTHDILGPANTDRIQMPWVFYQAWLAELTEPNFNMDDAAALSCKAKFFFGNYQDPWFALRAPQA